jgi:hypothetical protein
MDTVKVYIQHYQCGFDGELISCRHYKGDCRECSNHHKSFVEEKEVTKDELFDMIQSASDWYDVSTAKYEE